MKVYLDTVGCRLNQSEIEKLASQFRAAGHLIVETAAEADLVVVNTCSVTSEAAADSRKKTRQAARVGEAQIILTGCWATLEPDEAAALPHVARVVPNSDKAMLAADWLHLPLADFDLEPLAREPLPGARMRTRAFIKVQDGCDNFCTFCITRLARGKGISRPMEEIRRDIQLALAGGVKEIVLTGVHLGSWGRDLEGRQTLRGLIETLLCESGLERLRLSSLEPWDIDEHFFDLWQEQRLCRHLHLPLQSGSAAVLKRMARKTTPELFAEIAAAARSAAPDMALTTDLIVGFPGETDAEFNEGLQFVREMQFSGGHVFSFSARPGTAAARFTYQVPPAVRKRRSAELRAVVAESSLAYHRHFTGQVVNVLWETADKLGADGWRLNGLTDNYMKVQALSLKPLWNEFSRVRLEHLKQDTFDGKILSDEA